MGFKSGDATWQEGGDQIISESEQNIFSHVIWAMGGKRLNLFRWEKNAWAKSRPARPDTAGSFTLQAERYVALNARRAVLLPCLSRLRTDSIASVSGCCVAGINSQPAVPQLSFAIDGGTKLAGISVHNVGSANGGLPGDVFFGSFRPIPGMNADESAGI